MKFWIGAIAFFLALLAFTGCGGGGGTGSGGGTGNIVHYAVEATKGGTVIDPTNIVVGEQVQFQYVGYTDTNQRIVQGSSNWRLLDPGPSEGSITSGGSFTATASGPGFTVRTTANGADVDGAAQVRAAGQALVSGRVIDGYGNFGYGMRVDFFNSGSTLVGSSIVQGNGNFRAVVPTTAVSFQIRLSSIPSGYYKQYRYNSLWYLPDGFCMAPLPALTAGNQTGIGDILVPPTTNQGSSLPPPPPPSACP